MKLHPLPIDPHLPEIVSRLASPGSSLVLTAEPGSGKTTRVPAALLAAPGAGQIAVLEPRRLAAKLAAWRVADERATEVGGPEVGYHFRFEKVLGPSTRIVFYTEGMLLRRLQLDPALKGVTHVVLDEFHERHLHGDVALAALQAMRLAGKRSDLRLLVMSATLDAEPILRYLGPGATALRCEGAPHPLETRYRERAGVREAVEELDRELAPERGILVFLPGMREILRAKDELAGAVGSGGARRDWRVVALHGDLSREEQENAVKPIWQRKIVLSTNIAESSVTIPGVAGVVDTGTHRQMTHDPGTGVPVLRTRPISRASAIQRAGRAAREGAGIAVRLYSKHEFETRPSFDPPEIARADLAQVALELLELGFGDLGGIPWFEPPSRAGVLAALELLERLGAVKRESAVGQAAALTALGRAMAKIPAHPRLARAVIEGVRRGVGPSVATLCAEISEGAAPGETGFAVRKSRERLLAAANGAASPAPGSESGSEEDRVRFALLTGFPDRVALRVPGTDDFVASFGKRFAVSPADVQASDRCLLLLETREFDRGRRNLGRTFAIREEWLFDLDPPVLVEEARWAYDSDAGRVFYTERLAVGQATLSESRRFDRPLDRAGAEALLREGLDAGPSWREKPIFAVFETLEPALKRAAGGERPWGSLLDRARRHPSLGASQESPIADPHGELLDLVARTGCTSVREVAQAIAWPAAIRDLTGVDPAALDAALPEWLALPSGRRVQIHYPEDGSPPWAESYLQDFFGLQELPVLARGALKLTVRLLGPNKRPLQITQDLASFWAGTYPALKKELSRQYPRHHWPDDPASAKAALLKRHL